HNRSELTVTIAQLNAAIKFQRALLQWSSPAQLADASLHAILTTLTSVGSTEISVHVAWECFSTFVADSLINHATVSRTCAGTCSASPSTRTAMPAVLSTLPAETISSSTETSR